MVPFKFLGAFTALALVLFSGSAIGRFIWQVQVDYKILVLDCGLQMNWTHVPKWIILKGIGCDYIIIIYIEKCDKWKW